MNAEIIDGFSIFDFRFSIGAPPVAAIRKPLLIFDCGKTAEKAQPAIPLIGIRKSKIENRPPATAEYRKRNSHAC
jgi:hypothetical protein